MTPWNAAAGAAIAGLLAAPAFASAPTSPGTEARARALRRELDEMNALLLEQEERFARESVPAGGIAAALDAHAEGTAEAKAAAASVNRVLDAQSLHRRPAVIRAALLAEQLRRYTETGELSPTPPAVAARLRRLLESPWTAPPSTAEAARPSLDLAELQRQMRPYWELGRKAAPERPLAAAPRLPPPQAFGREEPPSFERDAGTGRPAADPVPALIVDLSSTTPRRRALAADQLASRGPEARPAVPALRRALSDPDRRVRASAALALGAAGDASAAVLDGLRRALKDADEEVRLDARSALRRLEAPPDVPAGMLK